MSYTWKSIAKSSDVWYKLQEKTLRNVQLCKDPDLNHGSIPIPMLK